MSALINRACRLLKPKQLNISLERQEVVGQLTRTKKRKACFRISPHVHTHTHARMCAHACTHTGVVKPMRQQVALKMKGHLRIQ